MPEKYILRTRGKVYFRRRGCPWVRIREPYGTPEFWRRYAELLAKAEAGELKTPRGMHPNRGRGDGCASSSSAARLACWPSIRKRSASGGW
jgi:hypothetical protein